MFKKKILIGLFAIMLIISGWIRLSQTANYQFPFTFDQARDLIHIRIPGTFKDLPMIGPTTSINGVMLGPGYYYFNLPAFWIWGGDPQGVVYWNIIWFLVSGVGIFWFFYKRNVWLGMIIGTSFLFAPQLFNATRYFWNAHAMIYGAVFFFLALWNYIEKKDHKSALILGMVSGAIMHFEAAMAVVMLVFGGLLVLSSKNKKIIGGYLLGAIPWFLPQMAFEVVRGFGMSKLLWSELSGGGGILGNKMTLAESAVSHWQTLQTYFEGQFILGYGWGRLVLLDALLGGWLSKKHRKLTGILAFFWAFVWLFYTVVYHHELKKWYGDSLRVWYVMIVGLGTVGWWEILKNRKFIKNIFALGVVIFMASRIVLAVGDQRQFINNEKFAKDDPKLMEHIIKTTEWIYEKMEGEGFEAYTYMPEIYDYPYSYTYWWYGRDKYGYMPHKMSYLPRVPEYMPRQEQFMTETKEGQNIGLIYERKGDYEDWLNSFSEYCLKEKIDFEWQVSAETRIKCKEEL